MECVVDGKDSLGKESPVGGGAKKTVHKSVYVHRLLVAASLSQWTLPKAEKARNCQKRESANPFFPVSAIFVAAFLRNRAH